MQAGYNPLFGARPLRRAVQRVVEDRLSEELLKQTFQKGDQIRVELEGEEVVVRVI